MFSSKTYKQSRREDVRRNVSVLSLEIFDDETENRSNTHAPLQVQGFAMTSAWDGEEQVMVWLKPDLLFGVSDV